MTIERFRKVNVRVGSAYSAGGSFRIDFNDLPKLPMGHSYVRWVELAVDVRWTNTTGGGLTIPEPVGHNIIANLQCKIAGGHTFFELGRQAGSTLYKAVHALSGMRSETPGDVVVGAGASVNSRYKVMIPIGYLFGAADPDDFNVPLEELQKNQVAIEGNWANGGAGGDFDTTGAGGFIVTGANTSIRTATVAMIARNELRAAPFLCYKVQTLSGIDERPTAGNHFLHSLIELPAANPTGATALTETFIGVARTQVDSLAFDGVNVVEQVPAADLVTAFNRRAFGADNMLTQHEAATTEFLPIYSPADREAKSTHKPSSRDHPNLVLVGTPSTPYILMVMSRLVDDRNLATSADALGVDSSSSAPSKTLTKTAVPLESQAGAAWRLPRLLEKGS